MFVVFEGIDGAGKTTMVDMACEYLRNKLGPEKVVQNRELGGSKLGEILRNIMYKEVPPREMAPGVLDLLFLMGHVQNWHTVVSPSLASEKIVVTDRWWYSQFTYATQREHDKRVLLLYKALKGKSADLLIFLHGDPEKLLARANSRKNADEHQKQKIWNDVEKQKKISEAYFQQYAHCPEFCPINVDDKSIDQVWHEVLTLIEVALEKYGSREDA